MTDGFGGTFTWNAEGRMAATAGVTYTGVYPERSRRDGDGRRVKKSDGRNQISTGRGGTTNSNRKLYWYGLGGAVLAESDLSGTITAEFIYFSGARIARRDLPSGNVYYFLADRLGTARVLTNASGTVVEESDFYPYGTERPIKTDHSVKNTYKFTGHERDTESGLDHTLHRQYASTLGRWHSPDPVRGKPANPQGWNRYAYAVGNPGNFIDSDGTSLCNPNDLFCDENLFYSFIYDDEVPRKCYLGSGLAFDRTFMPGWDCNTVIAYFLGFTLVQIGV